MILTDEAGIRELVRTVVREVLAEVATENGDPKLLDEATAADLLGMTREQLKQHRLAGRVIHRRLGRRVFYAASDLAGIGRTNN